MREDLHRLHQRLADVTFVGVSSKPELPAHVNRQRLLDNLHHRVYSAISCMLPLGKLIIASMQPSFAWSQMNIHVLCTNWLLSVKSVYLKNIMFVKHSDAPFARLLDAPMMSSIIGDIRNHGSRSDVCLIMTVFVKSNKFLESHK